MIANIQDKGERIQTCTKYKSLPFLYITTAVTRSQCCSGGRQQLQEWSLATSPSMDHLQMTLKIEVLLSVTYLFMVTTLTSAIIVVTPAVTVINVIWHSRQLHTKYFFFIAHLLPTKVTWIILATVLGQLIIILYLLDLNLRSVTFVLKWLIIPPFLVIYMMTILLPITVAVEHTIVIAFPFRHRNIMTTKIIASVLAAMWGLSTILSTIAMVTIPIDIVWPLGLIHIHPTGIAVLTQLISPVCIVAANGLLQYKITMSNRRAKENQRLGNEEEAKNSKKHLQKVKAQPKATITLFLIGGIDVIANILQIVTYLLIYSLIESNKKLYVLGFLLQLTENGLLFSEMLVYGLYMKKIRNRLPNWMVFYRKCIICRHNKAGALHQL